MNGVTLKASWLRRGYFDVGEEGHRPTVTQVIRDRLSEALGKQKQALRIAYYPVGAKWRYAYWWREGDVDYAEAQFFAGISREHAVLSAGISVEKGLEDTRSASRGSRATQLMDRKTWDWSGFVSDARTVLGKALPLCASRINRPLSVRFDASDHSSDQPRRREERVFVFDDNLWFERHEGKANLDVILDYIGELDQRAAFWVNVYITCDLFPAEVEGMTPDTFTDILAAVSPIRDAIRSRRVA